MPRNKVLLICYFVAVFSAAPKVLAEQQDTGFAGHFYENSLRNPQLAPDREYVAFLNGDTLHGGNPKINTACYTVSSQDLSDAV